MKFTKCRMEINQIIQGIFLLLLFGSDLGIVLNPVMYI